MSNRVQNLVPDNPVQSRVQVLSLYHSLALLNLQPQKFHRTSAGVGALFKAVVMIFHAW